MDDRLTPSTVLLLLVAPMLWAGNAVAGRLMMDLIPPMALNFGRWFLALLILIPLGRAAFTRGSGLLINWRRYAVLGLLGIGLFSGIQYMALHTSTPVNVTLVGASMPIWMLVFGTLFFRTRISLTQVWGALLSIAGVVLVLSHGDWRQLLALRFVVGDLYALGASMIWALYSWLLVAGRDSAQMRADWAAFLYAQVLYGIVWSAALAGLEWTVTDWTIVWGWPLVIGLIYVAVGPALIALRCWGAGVRRVGPSVAALFANLTPLFTALLSAVLLGEIPRLYHAVSFVLIVSGIIISVRR